MPTDIPTSSNLPSGTTHFTSQSLLTPTIKAWKIYLEDQNSSPHTVKAFTADLRLLASYLPPDRSLGDITTADLTNFLEWLQTGRGVPCSPKTLARRITSIKSFFRWLTKYGIILFDPAEDVPQISVVSPLPVVLTPDEVEAVLHAAAALRIAKKPDARSYVLAALLLQTGVKKSECLAISLNHIEFDSDGSANLFIRYADTQYRYKERQIPLSSRWVTAFREYQSQYTLDDRLFPWSQRRLEYLLEDLSEEAGINKHVSFEMCRWTCALTNWNQGMDRNEIRQKLGISKVQWREVSMKLKRLSGS